MSGKEDVGGWLEGVAMELQQQKAEHARRRANAQKRENLLGVSPTRTTSGVPVPVFRRRTQGGSQSRDRESQSQPQSQSQSQSPREFTTLRTHMRALENEWNKEKMSIQGDNLLLQIHNKELASQSEQLMDREHAASSTEAFTTRCEETRGLLEYQTDYELTRIHNEWHDDHLQMYVEHVSAVDAITRHEEATGSEYVNSLLQAEKEQNNDLREELDAVTKKLWEESKDREDAQRTAAGLQDMLDEVTRSADVLEAQLRTEIDLKGLVEKKLEAAVAETNMVREGTVTLREHGEKMGMKDEKIKSLEETVLVREKEIENAVKNTETTQKLLDDEHVARASSDEMYEKLHTTYVNDMQKLVDFQEGQVLMAAKAEQDDTEKTSFKLKIEELEDMLTLQEEEAAILAEKLNKKTVDVATETAEFLWVQQPSPRSSASPRHHSVLYEMACRGQRAAIECRQQEIASHEETTLTLRFAPSSMIAEGLSIALPQNGVVPSTSVNIMSKDTLFKGYEGDVEAVLDPSGVVLGAVEVVDGSAVFEELTMPREGYGEKVKFTLKGVGCCVSTGAVVVEEEDEEDRRAAQRLLRYKLSKLRKKHSLGEKRTIQQQQQPPPSTATPPSTIVSTPSPVREPSTGQPTPMSTAILAKLEEKMATIRSLSKTADPTLQPIFQELLSELLNIQSELGAGGGDYDSPPATPPRLAAPAAAEFPTIETIKGLLEDVETLKSALHHQERRPESPVTPPRLHEPVD